MRLVAARRRRAATYVQPITTLNMYTHAVDASHRKAVEAVERELFTVLDHSGLQNDDGAGNDTARNCDSVNRLGLEAPPGSEPGMEILQIRRGSLSCWLASSSGTGCHWFLVVFGVNGKFGRTRRRGSFRIRPSF
jgi:hypothetical protein